MGEQGEVVAALLAAARLPADDDEVAALARGYGELRAAVDRLYEVPADTVPATVYRCVDG